jgi:hypothetical protein
VKTLHERILDTLRSRLDWENRQRTWYQMRHDGLRRRRPPFPNANDLHYPLVDGAISKIKPFYYNQIFQGERIAEFTALEQPLAPQCESAADYFNWEVRQNTDFERKILSATDQMLLRGRGIIKVFWDPFKGKLAFSVIDPLYLIVPRRCDDLAEADYFVEVKQLTLGQYQREPRYDQSDEVIRQITGAQSYEQHAADQDKAFREGLTYSTNDEEVIIWEVYQKTRGGWTVQTYSPQAPKVPLRKPFGVPYRMNGEYFIPYESFQMEVKDEGWYSPRGLSELLAPFETSLCKLWNEKHDFLTFTNQPLFTSDDPIPPNMVNFRLAPGELLPKGIRPVPMPPVPPQIDEEMQLQRATAEQYVQMPDAGLAPDELRGARGGDRSVTATQVNYQASLASTGVDLRARVFRRSLCGLYRKAWAILVQHKKGEIAYFSGQDRKILPREALVESFAIEPDGSPDSWNKQTRIQRAMARLQVFRGDPAINQDQLKKDVLTADDPRLIKSVFLGQDLAKQVDGLQQALKILLLQEGYPVPVTEADDHLVALQIDLGWLQKQGHAGEPVDPIAQQRVHRDIAQHLQFLKHQNPAAAKQIAQLIQQAEQTPMTARAQPLGSTPNALVAPNADGNPRPGGASVLQTAGPSPDQNPLSAIPNGGEGRGEVVPFAASGASESLGRPARRLVASKPHEDGSLGEGGGEAVPVPMKGGASVPASPDIPTPSSLITPNSALAQRARRRKSTPPANLTPGTIYKGHRYLGGPPSKPSSWQKIKQPK